jgi:lysophospholipase L1-like esterase
MTITLIGDSLTAVNLGIPYSRYLDIPAESRLLNRGKDGDTIRGVLSRIEEALAEAEEGAVVLEIGANDILLPEMEARGGRWKAFTEDLVASGSVPTPDPGKFEELYGLLLRIVGDASPERIVVATIPPIGEDLGTYRNGLRERLNAGIRRAAEKASKTIPAVKLADVAAAFEEVLGEIDAVSDRFFGEPEDFAADARRVRRGKAAALSEERGLRLTTDGAHLNEEGARLLAAVVGEALRN